MLAVYKVLIVAVEEEVMANLANSHNNPYKLDEKKAVDIRCATKIGMEGPGQAGTGRDRRR